MRKVHIINLEKMDGVERLFLQYIHDKKRKMISFSASAIKLGLRFFSI